MNASYINDLISKHIFAYKREEELERLSISASLEIFIEDCLRVL